MKKLPFGFAEQSWAARRVEVHEYEIDLSIGDLVHIGDYVITLVDIDGREVSFRIDDEGDESVLLQHAGAATRHPK